MVTGGFTSQRPVTRNFDVVFFDLCLNKCLSKQSRRWWFEMLSHSLWRCNACGKISSRNIYNRISTYLIECYTGLHIQDYLTTCTSKTCERSKPPSHCCEFCLQTNTNWHSLRIAQHRIDSNYFVLVRCHFRISAQTNINVLKCSKHSYWPCELKPIHIASYCIAERRINSCQFLLVRISSLYIRIDSLYIRTRISRLSTATQYVAIRWATITLSYWIAHVRIGSCKFLLVPVMFLSHHSAIVLILHHHCTASYCIVSPSCCIFLHLTASYQFMFNSCLIHIDSKIIIALNHSGSA